MHFITKLRPSIVFFDLLYSIQMASTTVLVQRPAPSGRGSLFAEKRNPFLFQIKSLALLLQRCNRGGLCFAVGRRLLALTVL